MKEQRIVIIDGNSLINRAYYAIQRPMITKEGQYTQGIYGFLRMLAKIDKDYPSDYMVITFDRKAPTFRHLEYSEYKAGRSKMPMELATQLPILKDILDAMNISMLEMDGFEADDLIGTIAKKAEEKNLEPLIITGDRDELQLASDKTKVLITKKGITEFEIYDADAMIEKYGFTPTQFIDYKGLMGDKSDNIPGLPGVGEKTAQKLIIEYGSIENLLENAMSIDKQKLREKVIDNAQLAIMSKRLATINTNVPIEIDIEEYKQEKHNTEKLIKLYKKLEFHSFLKEMKVDMDTYVDSDEKEESEEAEEGENLVISNLSENAAMPDSIRVSGDSIFTVLSENIHENEEISIKVFSNKSHIAKPKVDSIFIMSTSRGVYVEIQNEEDIEQVAKVFEEKNISLIGHNLIDDYYALLCNGFTGFHTSFDTAIAQYLLEPTRSDYKIQDLILIYFNETMEDEGKIVDDGQQLGFIAQVENDFFEYGSKYCYAAIKLKEHLTLLLEKEELLEVFYDIEMPLIEILASMEKEGFTVEKNVLKDQGIELSKRISEVTDEIYKLAGEEFNIGSPKQLGVILFEKLGLPTGKKTKTGYSTGAGVLEGLAEHHDIIPLILEYRMLSKLNSTYVEGLIPLIGDDNKIHAHFNQTVTATGRISCTEPNLQNIPIRQEYGRMIRKAFVPKGEEYILLGADYSQIELRILAHLSKDETLIEAFRSGDDIHKITASRVFNINEDDVSMEQRSKAKAVNFGVIYGMGGFKLSNEINVSRKEADEYIDAYFRKYEKVKEYMDIQIEAGKTQGYVTTIKNRRRYIPEINDKNFMVRQAGQRLAMNTPIQGSAADIIKLAMIKVYDALKDAGLQSKLILQIHDELIIETHKDELEQVKQLLTENMQTAMILEIPLDVDMHTGLSWYELK